jgi:septal ring factor EnvC (AmiA/AmiB activator)
MANLFGILTAIVLAISALVAFKNKGAYDAGLAKSEELERQLASSQKRLKEANEILETLPVEIKAAEDEIAALTASEQAATKANEALKAEVEPITAKIASNKEQLDAIRAKTEQVGDLKGLTSKMRATNAELEELTQTIASAEAKLANLTSQNSLAESRINDGKRRIEDFNTGRSFPSLKTRIRSIYPNWGFVTLASGNNAGVVTNSTLDVVRGGETVAKLLVTAVESTTASASIIPDSLMSDATLMVGDLVVPGQKSVAPSAATN